MLSISRANGLGSSKLASSSSAIARHNRSSTGLSTGLRHSGLPLVLPSLGRDWTEHYDEASQQPYWYNVKTGESRWERPAHSTSSPKTSVSPKASVSPKRS
mmetsp:Transcript_3858/g.7135  ORF Transcript_3858/g.7135 Transcript_3858/m.7135 type:complete len:101 (-) Transcript_3858:224-526(-)